MVTRLTLLSYRLFSAALLATATTTIGHTQDGERPDETRRLPTYDEIRSEDWTERRDAFTLLIGTTHVTYGRSGGLPVIPELRELLDTEPDTAEARIERLIELLEIENAAGVEKRRQMYSNDPPYLPPDFRALATT